MIAYLTHRFEHSPMDPQQKHTKPTIQSATNAPFISVVTINKGRDTMTRPGRCWLQDGTIAWPLLLVPEQGAHWISLHLDRTVTQPPQRGPEHFCVKINNVHVQISDKNTAGFPYIPSAWTQQPHIRATEWQWPDLTGCRPEPCNEMSSSIAFPSFAASDVCRLETREQTGSSVPGEHVNMPLSASQRPYDSWCLKEWVEAEE